jgi:hypothetical protein
MVARMAGAREGIDQAAAAAGLGRRTGTFWSLRHLPPKVVWGVVDGAALWAFLLGFSSAYLLTPLLVPVALIVLAFIRYRVPPDGGRRWLVLYEHGMAELTPSPDGGQGRLRLIRWSELTGAVPDPARRGTYAVTVAPAGDAPAPPVLLADLDPAARLRRGLAGHLPHVPWPTGVTHEHCRMALTALGFAALAILPSLVPIARTQQAADAYDDSLVWPTPIVTASRAASPTPPASPIVSSPTVRILPLPTTTVGFYDMCKGAVTFPSAPAYSGAPPHPLYFPVPWFGDESWHATRPGDVQLIVCTKRSTDGGATIRSCAYQTSDGPYTQQLIKTTWTITLFEARTGRMVAQNTIVGGTTVCLPGLLPDYDVYPPALSKIQETSLTDRQAYDTVGRYVLR